MRTTRSALLLVLLLAALLRAWNLGGTSFWSDETYTMLTATHPDPVRSLVAIENSPPLYYAGLMPAWVSLGTGEGWARVPSLLAGLGCVLLAFRIGARISSPRAGLLAALLVACDAYAVTHSREARAYGLAALFSLWAVLETLEVAETSSTRAWIRLGCALLAACYTHYVQVFFGVAAAVVLVVRRPERRTFAGLALITLVGILAFLPWFGLMVAQMFRGNWYAPVWAGSHLGASPWKDAVYHVHRLLAWILLYNAPPVVYRALYLALPLSVALGWAVAWTTRSRVPAARTAVLFAGFILVLAGILWGLRAVCEPVYLIALFPLGLAILAVPLAEAWERRGPARVAASVALLLLVAIDAAGLREVYANRFHLEDRLTREPWSGIMSEVRRREADCDAIVVVPGWGTPAAWYLSRPETKPFYLVWKDEPYFRRMAPFARVTPGDPEETARAIRARHRRLLVIRSRPGFYTFEDSFWAALGGLERVRDEVVIGRVRIGTLSPEPAALGDTGINASISP